MKTNLSEPLTFLPIYKDYLWGGGRIAARYGRSGAPPVCAESWEVSARPDSPGIVAAGAFRGERLDSLARRFGAALTGTRAPDAGRFPLLFKLIDAKRNLSVQVHPNERNASGGGEPKTEAWVVLDREPGASLYAGLAAGVTPETFREAIARGAVEEKLVKCPVETGEALFIPGGLLHAIGAGCLVYEVQQNADTTYRVFDWNRVGADGKPRRLHIAEALRTIDWSLPPPAMRRPVPLAAGGAGRWSEIVRCPFFHLRGLALEGPVEIAQDGTTFHVCFVTDGRAEVSAGGGAAALGAGGSALIPAAAPSFRIAPSGGAPVRLLITTL